MDGKPVSSQFTPKLAACLIFFFVGHPRKMSMEYHKIHIGQLKMLHEMTGDGSFLKAAIEFTNDTNEDEGR